VCRGARRHRLARGLRDASRPPGSCAASCSHDRPSFSALYPLHTYLVDLYFLLPWTVALAQERLYTKRLLFWEEVRHTTRAATLAALFAIVLIYATKSTEEVSRLLLGSVWVTSLVAIPVRAEAPRVFFCGSAGGATNVDPGRRDDRRRMLQRVRGHRLLGHRPVGFLDDDPALHGNGDRRPARARSDR
jgi:hypothetical protein